MDFQNKFTTQWREFIFEKWKSGTPVIYECRSTGKRGYLPGYYIHLSLDWKLYNYFLSEIDTDLGI